MTGVVIFGLVGLWLLAVLACVCLGRAAAMGDRAVREALWLEDQEDGDWGWPARPAGEKEAA